MRLSSTFFKTKHNLTCTMHLSPVVSRAFWTTLSRGIVILDEVGDYSQASFWLDSDISCASARMSAPEWGDFTGYYIDTAGEMIFVCRPEDYPGIVIDSLYAVGSFNSWQFSDEWRFQRGLIDGEHAWILKTQPWKCFPPDGGPAVFKFCTEAGVWLEPPNHFLNRSRDNHGNRNLLLWPKFTEPVNLITPPLPPRPDETENLRLTMAITEAPSDANDLLGTSPIPPPPPLSIFQSFD